MVKIISFFMSLIISFCSLFGMKLSPIAFKLDADKLDKKISTSQEKRIDNGLNTGAHIIVPELSGVSSFDSDALPPVPEEPLSSCGVL